MHKIFISYRRDDSNWSTRLIYDKLAKHFSPDQIFLDIDSIDLGDDFVILIENAVLSCDVLLAIIGQKWLPIIQTKAGGIDYVRIEIATALKNNIRVVPVYVDDTKVPAASDLPEDLKLLARKNSFFITMLSFNAEMESLIQNLKNIFLEQEQLKPVITKPSGNTAIEPPSPMKIAGSSKKIKIRSSMFWISGVGFLICTLAACWLIVFREQMVALGIVDNVYYLIVTALAVSGAGFLFGSMKSYTPYTTNTTFSKLTISVPIVLFTLVVSGGFIIPELNKKYGDFQQKFRIVQDSLESTASINGKISLFLPDQRVIILPLLKGETTVPNIPNRYLHTSGIVVVDLDNSQKPDTVPVKLSNDICVINVRKTEQPAFIAFTLTRGTLISKNGRPLKGAVLDFGSGMVKVTTDDSGDFIARVPVADGHIVRLNISYNGKTIYSKEVVISGNVPLNPPL